MFLPILTVTDPIFGDLGAASPVASQLLQALNFIGKDRVAAFLV